MVITHTDIDAGMSRVISGSIRVYVMYVYQHDNTKTTGCVIAELGRWIAHDTSWSPIVFGGNPDSFVDSGSFSRILYH